MKRFPMIVCAMLLFCAGANAATGMVYVKTTPPGAAISIDGETKGVSPQLIRGLPPGEIRITLSLPGIEPEHVDVDIVAGSVAKVDRKLSVPKAMLTVITEPLEAEVYVDRSLRGKSPLTVEDLEPGEHEIIVILDNHVRVAEQVQLKSGESRVLEIELKQVAVLAVAKFFPPKQPVKKSKGSVSSKGLMLYWKCDLTSKSGVKDYSGRKRHGRLIGGVGREVGIKKTALSFDGVDDLVVHKTSLNKHAGTIAHWIKPTGTGDMVIYYESSADGQAGDGFGHYRSVLEIHTGVLNGRWVGVYQCGGQVALASGGSVTADKWVHVVMTWTVGGELYLYVDGRRAAIKSVGAISSRPPTTKFIQVGAPGSMEQRRRFTGLLDEVRVYSRALSPEEVECLATRE